MSVMSCCTKRDRLAVLLPVTSRRPPACTGDGLKSSAGPGCESTPQQNAQAALSGLQRLAESFKGSTDSQNARTMSLAENCCSAADSQHSAGHHDSCGDSNSSSCEAVVSVLIGIDSDDECLLQHQKQMLDLFAAAEVPATVIIFSEADRSGHGPGAVCHLWGLMAREAVKEGCSLAVLLGDDTEVQPAGWPSQVLSAFSAAPQLMLLLLIDAADPGFPSFPVLRVDRHLELFGELLPPCFVNQGGDPYLAGLYRRWAGCVSMLPGVTVYNQIGGVQRSDKPYTVPRYGRCSVSKERMLQQLRLATSALRSLADRSSSSSSSSTSTSRTGSAGGSAVGPGTLNSSIKKATDMASLGDLSTGLSSSSAAEGSPLGQSDNCLTPGRAAQGPPQRGRSDIRLVSGGGGRSAGMDGVLATKQRQLAVDVLVPTARVDVVLLQGIADAVLAQPSPPGSDLGLILVVDQPRSALSARQALWLQQLQDKWLNKVRVRYNDTNLGASATRNRALQESLAEYVIMWDDDIQPAHACLAAYVDTFHKHPQALGFAGPSYIPKQPSNLWCCAVHQADVLFFWDAAEDWRLSEVMPWAVTANVAVVNTSTLFDLRFPKTGGGEDIDYCLKITGGRLLPVPQAAVRHPLWNGGRRCYKRFFGWAFGDGALIPMYPQLCYWAAPNSAEACCALLLLAAAAAAAAAAVTMIAQASTLLLFGSSTLAMMLSDPFSPVAAATGLAGVANAPGMLPAPGGADLTLLGTWATGAGDRWRGSAVLLAAAVGFKLMDAAMDVGRAFTQERVAKHPCSSWWLRVAAAFESSLIKTWSEFGRLCGHAARRELLMGVICRRFDWFGGLSAEIVAGERWKGGVRFVVCAIAAAAAATLAKLSGR